MSEELFTLAQAAELLKVKSYVVTYLLTTKKVAEPRRIGGRRVFTVTDLTRIGEVLKLSPELWKEAVNASK